MYSHFAERRKKALRGDGGLGVGMGWGGGIGLLGVGEIQQAAFFTTLPPRSSLPDPELPQDVCQLTKGAIFISFENRSNFMQFPCSTD